MPLCSGSCGRELSESGRNQEGAELKRERRGDAAERGEVVPVVVFAPSEGERRRRQEEAAVGPKAPTAARMFAPNRPAEVRASA
jgi:hypothetical protein